LAAFTLVAFNMPASRFLTAMIVVELQAMTA
jgi:hypothetical protein